MVKIKIETVVCRLRFKSYPRLRRLAARLVCRRMCRLACRRLPYEAAAAPAPTSGPPEISTARPSFSLWPALALSAHADSANVNSMINVKAIKSFRFIWATP